MLEYERASKNRGKMIREIFHELFEMPWRDLCTGILHCTFSFFSFHLAVGKKLNTNKKLKEK